jgi:hypothetical protein
LDRIWTLYHSAAQSPLRRLPRATANPRFSRATAAATSPPGTSPGTALTEERKHAILFAATILSARKLMDMDPNRPNMAKQFYVDHAIAAFILERIDERSPGIVDSFSTKP